MRRYKWRLVVVRPFRADYMDVDKQIAKTVGRGEDGAGVGFGERDMSFVHLLDKAQELR